MTVQHLGVRFSKG